MKLTSYAIINGDFVCDFDVVDDNKLLAFGIRNNINEPFYSFFVPFEKSDNTHKLHLANLFDYLKFSLPTGIELFLIDRKDGSVEPVVFDKDLVGAETLNYDDSISLTMSFKRKTGFEKKLCFECSIIVNNNPVFEMDESGKTLLLADKKFEGSDFFVSKRMLRQRENCYSIVLPISMSNGQISIDSIFKIIGESVEFGDEIWDVYLEYDGIKVPVVFNSQEQFDYCEINADFCGKIFKSDDKFLSIYTKENTHLNNNKIKVAVIGTCFSKNALFSDKYFNPDYKRFYENNVIFFHQTMESLVSKPFEIDKAKILDGQEKRLLELYAHKQFFKGFEIELANYSPKYLIIDLYNESHSALLKFGENIYIDDCFYFENNNYFESLIPEIVIRHNDTSRFELFEKAVIQFRKKVKGLIDFHNIILVMPHSSNQSIDKNGAIKPITTVDPRQHLALNRCWDQYNSIFLKIIPEARTIDLRYGHYCGGIESPLGLSPNHLESRYYKDLLNLFNKIVLEDLIRGR